MAEAIQFHCPACGITLRVPVAASGTQGPCPRCRQEIICPDLSTGVGARRVAMLPAATAPTRPSREADPFNPFAHRQPAEPVLEPLQPVPEPLQPALEPLQPSPEPLQPLPEPLQPVPEPLQPAPEALQPSLESLQPAPESSQSTDDPEPEPEPPHPPLSEPPFVASTPEPLAEVPVPVAAAQPPATRAATPASPTLGAGWVMVLLLFFSLLAALAGFFAGYGVGLRNAPLAPAPVSAPASAPPPVAERKAEPPAPEPPVEPPPAEAPPAEPDPPPIKVIAAPEAALKAFLSAPDWRSRAKHVLHPEATVEKMEAYHADTPDGPTAVLSLKVDAAHDDLESGSKLFTYRVTTEAAPAGFPVAIMQTPDGWKVDWETFVEFRDDHFRRFAAGEGSDTGAFHLLVRNTHYFGEAFPGSEKLVAFRVDPPMPEREQYAFVATGSEIHKTLAAATEQGRLCAPVVQLARKTRDDGKTHLEITAILAPNWRPQE